jgi:hypothetical protein
MTPTDAVAAAVAAEREACADLAFAVYQRHVDIVGQGQFESDAAPIRHLAASDAANEIERAIRARGSKTR